jgi:PAS domain S-box-containing protein
MTQPPDMNGLAPEVAPESEIKMRALADAFDMFMQTTKTLEESYRRLEERVHEMDKELEAKNRDLELANDYLNSILESMSDGVIAVGRDGTVITFNRAAGAVLGYDAAEVSGKPFREVFGREFSAHPGNDPVKLRAKSGREVTITERDSPIAGCDNRRIGKVKVFQDLSEILALREQLRQFDRLAAIGEMAAAVAHEIRNPLGGIRGFASLLIRDIPEDDPRRRLVDKILMGTQRLDRVITELLEYTRPVELRLAPVQCIEIVASSLDFVDLGGRPVVLHNDVDPALRCLADAEKLSQVILNLVINAMQSIDGEGSVTITSEHDENAVRLLVRDTGCGIEPEKMAKIFSPFFTTKEKGAGLGLAVVAKIIEGHGGSIVVESEPGHGSTFVITLARTE